MSCILEVVRLVNFGGTLKCICDNLHPKGVNDSLCANWIDLEMHISPSVSNLRCKRKRRHTHPGKHISKQNKKDGQTIRVLEG